MTCLGLGPSPLTPTELNTCREEYIGCKEPKWYTLIEGGRSLLSIKALECALKELSENGLSRTGLADMLHMKRILFELHNIAKTDASELGLDDIAKTDASIEEIKGKITEIVEILTKRTSSPVEKSYFDTLEALNIPSITVNGLHGTARYLSSAEAKQR